MGRVTDERVSARRSAWHEDALAPVRTSQSSLTSCSVDMSSTLPTEAQILEAVDKLRDDAVHMLHEIVAHPSLLGDEKSVQDFMESKFKALNDPHLTVKRVPILRTY